MSASVITTVVRLVVLPAELAVCRLSAEMPLPLWAVSASFFSATRTADELSLVVSDEAVPADILAERGWRVLQVQGPLPFHLTGILASLAAPLAEARISIFALSTFDTDYVLVKAETLNNAITILKAAGHQFSE